MQSGKPFSALLICLALAAGATSVGEAATLTTYPDEASFLAAIGSSFTSEDFDSFSNGTVISTQVGGVTFSSPNATLEGFLPVGAYSTTGAVSAPNILGGGSIPGSPTPPQVIVMDFDPGIYGLAFYLAAQAPDATDVTVLLEFTDESTETRFIGDTDGNENTGEFFGTTSDRRIFRVTLTSGLEAMGEGGFEEFGIDNLAFTTVEQNPPDCSGTPTDVEGTSAIDGTATDNDFGDTGIASVALAPGAMNVTLSVDPDFTPGAGSVTFLATQTDSSDDAHGTVVVTDGADNTCTLPVNFRNLPAGPTENETICSGGGILVSVSNDSATPAGTSACSSNTPASTDPVLPPGYEPSPPEDPSPCRVCSILSPISGLTKMVYKKDGPFEPRLRLLYSKAEGDVFPPFTDITESVEEIATLTPDPTRAEGKGTWSHVKVTCALQNEICNGVDDDGDGVVDEGLPVGAPVVDCDGDGFPLCSASGTAVTCSGATSEVATGTATDCNDQIASIHPGATEICNGLDDDCDGLTDENFVLGDYLPPVNPDGSSIFRRKQTIPFKIQVTDCSGAIVTTVTPMIHVFFYTSGVIGSELEEVTSPGAANTDNLYRLVDGKYIYNLSTLTLLPNTTYLVQTTLDDGTTKPVLISIK